jgi:peptidoglycan-N-acetylglucosamine deacetylase
MNLRNAEWLFSLIYPSLTWSVKTDKPELFLTFDDGPIPGMTEFVLEELQKWGIEATFFCVGDNISKHNDIYNRILAENHSVGNHTYNHLNGWKTKDETYFDNIDRCCIVMSGFVENDRKMLYRPPYGKIKRSQIKKLQENYQIVMWNVLTRDYDASLDEEQCLKNAIKNTSNGSIIVFHDNVKAEKNLKYVLPKYIENCLSKGFVFKKL